MKKELEFSRIFMTTSGRTQNELLYVWGGRVWEHRLVYGIKWCQMKNIRMKINHDSNNMKMNGLAVTRFHLFTAKLCTKVSMEHVIEMF